MQLNKLCTRLFAHKFVQQNFSPMETLPPWYRSLPQLTCVSMNGTKYLRVQKGAGGGGLQSLFGVKTADGKMGQR